MVLLSYWKVRKCLPSLNRSINYYRNNIPIMRGMSSTKVDVDLNKNSNNTYNIGTIIEGYRLKTITPVKELNLVAYELNHERSGANHLHIEASDPNNAFSVSFKTPVVNDTGVSHILEHMVLCGSKKYPVHDPFFKMSLRSVSTFMNAMTFPDHTTYPFSSVNKKDFNNLLSVYMDCIFNPCLRKDDFLQEAWRIEHETANDSKTPLVFKGVVFNEMKGVLNSQSSVQDLEYTKHLLPTTYAANYGGNPLNIIDLTYENLVEFHHKFYHPSNSLFITYGNIPMVEHLETLNKLLSDTTDKNKPVTLPKEKFWDSNRRAESYVPFDPLLPSDRQSIYLLGYKMNPVNYNRDIFLMSILSQLLLVGPNSAFHKFLLTKNLGADYCDHVGLNSYTNDPTFCVGLKGVKDEDVSQIEDIIISTLDNVKKNGFTDNHILGVMKETELAIKHIGSNTGINYATSLPTNWAHGHNPSECLMVKEHLDYVYENYKKGILENILVDNLIENSHRLSLHLKPDIKFTEKLKQEESTILNQRIKNNDGDFKSIERKVEDPELVDKILPKVTLEDLSADIPSYVAEQNIIGDETPLQTSTQPTNGLAYVRININTNSLPLLLRPYLPLFSHVITQIGAREMSHEQIAELISLNSSPYTANPVVRVDLDNVNDCDKGLMFTSFCPYDNTIKMMEIWNAIFSKPSIINDEHMRILVSEYIDSQLSSVIDSGHQYAIARACSHLTRPYAYRELLSGWSQVEFSKHLADRLSNDTNAMMDSICEKLLEIASCLFDRSKFSCFVISEDHFMNNLMNTMNNFISEVPVNFEEPFPMSKSQKSTAINNQIKEFIYMPSRVNYNASSYRIPSFLHPDYPLFKVLSLLVTSKFLLPNIREIGGAYGAGAIASDGCLSFYSYRDPNLLSTYNNFEKSIQWLINREYDLKSFEESKVKAIGSILQPIPPSKRTLALFTNGITHQHLVNYRDTIKNCQPEDIERIAKMYLCEQCDDSEKSLPFISSASVGEYYDEIKNDESWVLNNQHNTSKTD